MNVQVDFNTITGPVKRMHCVGQPPFAGGFFKFDFSYMENLTKANIPYARLHDVGGAFGGNRFVDIPNLFRDFDADENDPASYDFAFTDELLKAMHQYNIKPVFRLGVTIENQCHIKAYRIHPPADPAKWVRVCEHVIRHYNEGWADGFTYGIEYWEIWNEPDNGLPERNQMWTGTPEQYYELYDVTAKHLKACFGDTIKVGGYAATGFFGIFYHPEKYGLEQPRVEPDKRYEKFTARIRYLHGFLKYIRSHGSPLDFFSWHSYFDVEKTLIMDEFLHKTLCQYGYGDVERHLNEWNNADNRLLHGTSFASAAAAAMLCGMQDSHTDMLCYYDARLTASTYGGFFAPLTYETTCTYQVFSAFGQLYGLKNQVKCSCDQGLYTLAATDGEKKALLITNPTEECRQIQLNADADWSVYLIDREHHMTKEPLDPREFPLGANQVVFIKNY